MWTRSVLPTTRMQKQNSISGTFVLLLPSCRGGMGLGPVKTEGNPACCSSSNSRNLHKLVVPDAEISCRHSGSGVQPAPGQLLQHGGQYSHWQEEKTSSGCSGREDMWPSGFERKSSSSNPVIQYLVYF